MRFQKQFCLIGLVALLGLALFIAGCGSDDTPTTISGSMTDPEFVAVQTEVNTFVDSTISFLKNSLYSTSAVATFDDFIDPVFYGPVQPETDVFNATYENGWHVVYMTQAWDSYGFVLRDSIQFFKDDQVQQRGVDSDSLYFRHRWLITANDTTVTHQNYQGSNQFTCTGLDGIQATVNGTNNWMLDGKTVSGQSQIWRDIEINANINNVVINKTSNGWISGCPVSGTVAATVQMTYKNGDATPLVSNWTVSLSFNNGNMVANIQQGNYTWSYSGEICTVEQ